MNILGWNIPRAVEFTLAAVATLGIGALVAADGRMPSPFTTLFFLPIILVAYRQPLGLSLAITVVATFFSSPALAVLGAKVDDSVMPVLWLGWPAVYLFLTVTLNQWASIQQQHRQLEATERHLLDVQARNDKREQELETLSSIHATILSGSDEAAVVGEITRRVAEVAGARLCAIVVPTGAGGQGPMKPMGQGEEALARVFPQGIPYGEGVAGWAILHRRIAASRNVFQDPRYDQLRELAVAAGFVASAAAPVELEQDLYGALLVCYADERDFAADELTRLERLARQTELAIRSVHQRSTLARFAFDTALALTEAIESRDPYTGGHCRRLAEYAARIASKLALPVRDIEVVRLGAALHDMGKIVVPDSILKKPGRLTPEEYAIVKQHCYSGGQICKRVGFLMDAYPIVYHHHERWDGTGYPDGLKDERIPIGARVVAVVDAYDAITTDRPYRDAVSHEEAAEILRQGAGSQWDPAVARVFLETIEADGDHPQGPNGRAAPHSLILPGVPDPATWPH